MNNVIVWHNPRCSKSRNTVALLEENGIEMTVVKYLETPPNKEEISNILKMLNMSARELMRTKED
ncbi:MAG: arsenate reductase (glutaredoxin), partial [Sulfurovum sp.]